MSKLRDFDGLLQSYRLLSEAHLPCEAEIHRSKTLRSFADQAILEASYFGRSKEAWKIYWGRFYPWSARITPGGIRRV